MDLRRIDALVAERLMGWRREEFIAYPGDENFPHTRFISPSGEVEEVAGQESDPDVPITYGDLDSVPSYSADMGAAWQVAELFPEGFSLRLEDGVWTCWVTVTVDDGLESFDAKAETAPRAITLAALKARGIDVTSP